MRQEMGGLDGEAEECCRFVEAKEMLGLDVDNGLGGSGRGRVDSDDGRSMR